VPIEDIMQKYVGRFRDKKPDWAAFEDAKIEGYKRAQHRFIGAGGSGKHGDPTVIPAKNFTLSIMYVEPGQGNAAHTHEVEECFFVLQGFLDVFVEDEGGKRLTTRLGPWECIACPAGVIHGYQNDSLAPVYFQVMLGRAKPETMGYADDELYKRRDAHLKAVGPRTHRRVFVPGAPCGGGVGAPHGACGPVAAGRAEPHRGRSAQGGFRRATLQNPREPPRPASTHPTMRESLRLRPRGTDHLRPL